MQYIKHPYTQSPQRANVGSQGASFSRRTPFFKIGVLVVCVLVIVGLKYHWANSAIKRQHFLKEETRRRPQMITKKSAVEAPLRVSKIRELHSASRDAKSLSLPTKASSTSRANLGGAAGTKNSDPYRIFRQKNNNRHHLGEATVSMKRKDKFTT